MARFCTNCGSELADEAAVCIKCGINVNQGTNANTNTVNNTTGKKKGLPTWAIVLIIVGCVVLIPLIIVIVLFVIGYNAIKDVGIDEIDKINDYINENSGSIKTGTINDTLSDGEVKLTLTGAYMYDSIGEEPYVYTPEEGKEYLLFFFEVENVSSEINYISEYSFDGYADDVSVSTTSLYSEVDDTEQLSATITSGKKARGYIAFEVDKTWKDFEVHYKDSIWDDKDTLVFKIVNSD